MGGVCSGCLTEIRCVRLATYLTINVPAMLAKRVDSIITISNKPKGAPADSWAGTTVWREKAIICSAN